LKTKTPLTKKRILELKKLIEEGDGRTAALRMRDLREGLEEYCEKMDKKKPRTT
jgi:hypothetical protein